MFQDLTLIALWLLISIHAIRTLYFIQLKEYRFDRLYDFIRYDSGILKIANPISCSTYFFAIIAQTLELTYANYIILSLLFLSLIYNNFLNAKLRFWPTAKALLIYCINIILLALIIAKTGFLIAYLSAPFLIILVVCLFTPITLIGKELRIRKAIKKMQQYPNIKVIAITGSYGKSSIKHYLTQVLSSHYNVVSTPKNINTDIGIANLILTKINKDTEVFVVECGAYKIGEIANSVRMFQTDFAVLSAIAPQHLSLFGSIDNIKLAKSEIANTLKESGELYLNIDNKYIQEATPNFLNRNLTSYGLSNTATLQIKNVSTNPNLSFDLLDQNFTTNLTAEHNALNLAPVISIANKLKIPFSDIQKILTNLTNLDSTLNKKSGKNQVQILDDSYNSNIDGFQSAIKLANSTQAKTKILITMGFIELGRLTAPAHTEIADAISDKFDILIITKPNIFQYFKHLTHPEVLLLTNPNQIVDYLEKYLNSDTLILIENRLNSKVHKYLLSQ